MKIVTFLTIFLISISGVLAAGPELQNLLKIKPGTKLQKSMRSNASAKDFSYEIEKDKDLVKSVMIYFHSSVSSSKYLKSNSKGFCLIQPSDTDLVQNRYFFFDLKGQRRYELTSKKEIKSILIQDLPGAKTNPACTFGSFKMEEK